jgi:hypothetical protein
MTRREPRGTRVTVADMDWMRSSACAAPAVAVLPWTTDREHVDPADKLAMEATCGSCPVLADCAAYAKAVSGGFWAGKHRDRPSLSEGVQLQFPWAS